MVATTQREAVETGESLDELLQRATEKLNAGRIEEARRRYRDIAARHPEQPGAWFLLGLAAREAGDRKAAHAAFKQAARLRPAHPAYQLHLGRVCRALGRRDEADEALSVACLLAPRSARAFLYLGLTRMEGDAFFQGLAAAGRACLLGLRAVLARSVRAVLLPYEAARLSAGSGVHPAAARALVYAGHLTAADESDRAIGVLSQAARGHPEDTRLKAALADLLRRSGRHAAALELYEQALKQDPSDPALVAGKALALNRLGRSHQALTFLDALPDDIAQSPACQEARGWALYHEGRATDAAACFSASLDAGPAHATAWHGRGSALRSLGRMREAAADFETAIDTNPRYAPAYLALAAIGGIAIGSPGFERLRNLAASPETPRAARSQLQFAIARIHREAGDHAGAIAHYRDANRLKDVVFCQESWSAHIDRLIETFDADFFRRFEGLGDPDARPVFVVGMPRSGTSLVEQILASHPEAEGAGELEKINLIAAALDRKLDSDYPRGLAELNGGWTVEAAADYLEVIDELAPGAARVIDKMPNNFLHLGLIACLFPQARIVHCRRDPSDTCLSIFSLDFTGHHPYAYSLENLGFYHREYQRLMAHWRRVLPLAMLDVDYERLVENQEEQTRRLLAFCELNWDARCLRFHENAGSVRTASFAQVRQPIYRSAAGWSRFRGGAFDDFLAPLQNALRGEGRCAPR